MQLVLPGREEPTRRQRVIAWALAATVFPVANEGLCRLFDGSPFFMDSVFTALSAALFGPWQGLLTAFLTNAFQEATRGFTGHNLPFAACGMATAAIVWAFAGHPRLRLPWRIFACDLSASLANALLGAFLTTLLFGGGSGATVDNLSSGFAMITGSSFMAAFLARIPVNLIDKAVAVIPALCLAEWISRREAARGSRARLPRPS